MSRLRRAIFDRACERHHLVAQHFGYFGDCKVLRCRIAHRVGK
jgi:hypothetical protein